MGLGNKTKLSCLTKLYALELGVQALIFVAYSITRHIFVRGIIISKNMFLHKQALAYLFYLSSPALHLTCCQSGMAVMNLYLYQPW